MGPWTLRKWRHLLVQTSRQSGRNKICYLEVQPSTMLSLRWPPISFYTPNHSVHRQLLFTLAISHRKNTLCQAASKNSRSPHRFIQAPRSWVYHERCRILHSSAGRRWSVRRNLAKFYLVAPPPGRKPRGWEWMAIRFRTGSWILRRTSVPTLFRYEGSIRDW